MYTPQARIRPFLMNGFEELGLVSGNSRGFEFGVVGSRDAGIHGSHATPHLNELLLNPKP